MASNQKFIFKIFNDLRQENQVTPHFTSRYLFIGAIPIRDCRRTTRMGFPFPLSFIQRSCAGCRVSFNPALASDTAPGVSYRSHCSPGVWNRNPNYRRKKLAVDVRAETILMFMLRFCDSRFRRALFTRRSERLVERKQMNSFAISQTAFRDSFLLFQDYIVTRTGSFNPGKSWFIKYSLASLHMGTYYNSKEPWRSWRKVSDKVGRWRTNFNTKNIACNI